MTPPTPSPSPRPVLSSGSGFISTVSRIAELPGPPGLPLIGNLHQFKAGRFHAQLEDWARQYGPLYRLRLRSLTAVGISEPGLIQEVLRQRPTLVRRSPRLAAVIEETGFRGLFTAEGERWKRQRRLVMHALRPEITRHFFPIIHSVTERLRARWSDAVRRHAQVNVARDLKRYSIDVMTWLSMGVDIDTLQHEDDPLQDDVELWFSTIGQRMSAVVPHWRHIKLPADRRADAMQARLMATVQRLIERARLQLRAEPARASCPTNILEALVAARDLPGSEFDDEDVVGNVATMLFAGEDTTATTMAWLLHFLAETPDAARHAAQEADTTMSGDATVTRHEQLEQLRYLEAAATESMRLKPIAPLQGMCANVDLDLAGLQVPAGTLMFLLPRLHATDAASYPEPALFRPERFLAGHTVDDAHRSFFPFGGGPRFCPGRYLAMVKIRMVVSMVLRNFHLGVDLGGAAVREHYTMTLGPTSLPVRLSLRPQGVPA